MEFVLSERGKELILLDSFKFYQKNVTTSGVKWCCTVKTCNAKIYVCQNKKVILKREDMHNHLVSQRLSRQIVSNSVKRKAAEDICEKPAKLLHKELKTSAFGNNLDISDVNSIKRRMYDARRRILPRLPTNIEEVHETLRLIDLKTNRGENFLLVNDLEKNLIIFSTETNLKAMCTMPTIYVDGTFRYCTKYFYQMFSVHGILNGHYVPLIFCLLKNKCRETYFNAFTSIIEECAKIGLICSPKLVFSDFEVAIQQAVRLAFPSAGLKGCRFHLGQSWWRKIQELGLSREYQDNNSEKGNYIK